MSAKARRYLRNSLAIAAVSGAALAVWALAARPEGGLAWSAVGWASVATVGVAGGAWIASLHSRPGMGFVVAVLASMLARLFAVAVGAALAAGTGNGALEAYLVGLALGFVPLQVYEVAFFYREVRSTAPSPATGSLKG